MTARHGSRAGAVVPTGGAMTRWAMRSIGVAAIAMFAGACVSTSSDLGSYDVADIRRPAAPFDVAYTLAFHPSGVGLLNRGQVDRAIQRVFDATGFFASAKDRATSSGVTLSMRLDASYHEHTWAVVVTALTVFVVPAPITSYQHTLTAQLRRDGVLLGEFHYTSRSSLWFGIVCLPAFLFGQPFDAGEAVLEELLLNLLHDLSDPAVLQRVATSAPKA